MTKIHPLADVQSTQIGEGTVVWQFSVILEGAKIGKHCNINCHTFIESDVIIGNNVTVKAGVYLWNGIRIADDVFIGPNVTFTNDLTPRSKAYPATFDQTVIQTGASIGANATIIGGIIIGAYALIGAGSVVTKTVPAHALVYGNPAKITGWVDREGKKMKQEQGFWLTESGERYIVEDFILKKADNSF